MRPWLGLFALVLCVGCSQSRGVVDAFPPSAIATPWVLQDRVWHGTIDEAAPGLGDDVIFWRSRGAQDVWLARYCHRERPNRCLTIRCFAFDDEGRAAAAYEAYKPTDAEPFTAGDEGCWTPIGVMFHWDRLVFDVFGPDESSTNQWQAAMLASFVLNRMPDGVPAAPQ